MEKSQKRVETEPSTQSDCLSNNFSCNSPQSPANIKIMIPFRSSMPSSKLQFFLKAIFFQSFNANLM